MKKLSNPICLTCICGALGLLCLPLRLWMMHTGIDSKALMIGSHPGNILSWVLTALLAAVLVAAMVVKPDKYSFRPGVFSGFGAVAAALALAMTAVFAFRGEASHLSVTFGVLAALGVVSNGLLAFFRFGGKRGWLPLYLPAVLTLMLQFLYCFRIWSSEPELQRYFFSLAAQICILLTLFYRICVECKMQKPVLYLLLSCASIFFGFAAGTDGGPGFLYGIWAAAILLENLGLRVARRKNHEAA